MAHRVSGRRVFLSSAWRSVVAVGASRLIPWSNDARLLAQTAVPKGHMLTRSVQPENLETPVSLLNSWITPNELFYVRSHMNTPSAELAAWSLSIHGDVERPLTLRMADLAQMPTVSMAVTLECAGNGRAFFEPPLTGVQWEKGAVGNARWTGVRLADVLKRAGVKTAARYVWLDGADRPSDSMPDFVRQLPLDKAMHPDTLLAYAMNGVPLPIQHGFPLRAIVPGWEGAYSVKWLTDLQVSDREHDGFFVQTGYRYPIRRVAPGATVDPKDLAPLTGLLVKSIISAPVDGAIVAPGTVSISGFAWTGGARITRVDVSVDSGATWQPATLGSDLERHAWRQFEYRWRVTEPGSYVIFARAADDRGRVQPIAAQWNPSGYVWNAIDRVRVSVG